MTTIIGWDIGGAHLKAALLREGEIQAVEQLACPLWLGTEHLAEAWRTIAARFGAADRHAVTMTGELAEIFPDRPSGVAAICAAAETLADGAEVGFYAARPIFLAKPDSIEAWREVASANWHASAVWAAKAVAHGLFVDIGSTTTDIVPFAADTPVPRGLTDADRLEAGELVYSGVVRTSLMALGGEAPFEGRRQRLMAENFATTADIYRLSGELAPEDDSYPSSDGRGKGAADCRARIARMFGRDSDETHDAMWDEAARLFRGRQLHHLAEAVAQVLSRGNIPARAPFVAAGAGHFLVEELARRFARPALAFAEIVPARENIRRKAGVCAPAVAVALLAARM
jgi:probable H4MPT-linked C1 transfer pathway protein